MGQEKDWVQGIPGEGLEGWKPTPLQKGFQPADNVTYRPEPGAGYQPTGHGDNPTNVPTPPKER